jgi:hypothetical protein
MLRWMPGRAKGERKMTASVIAVQGEDNSLWCYWQTVGTTPWNPEQAAGPIARCS